MNKIWIWIIVICIFYGIFTGRFDLMANSILALPSESLELEYFQLVFGQAL